MEADTSTTAYTEDAITQTSLRERFQRKVLYSDPESCWMWNAGKNSKGYGQIRDEKMKPAHRVAYELDVDPIPKGMCVLHKCDVPACVNIGHLRVGTKADNNRDRHEKGRSGDHKGENNGKAKLSEKQVLEIRSLYSTGRFSQVVLAERFNVSCQNIYLIVNNRTWKL